MYCIYLKQKHHFSQNSRCEVWPHCVVFAMATNLCIMKMGDNYVFGRKKKLCLLMSQNDETLTGFGRLKFGYLRQRKRQSRHSEEILIVSTNILACADLPLSPTKITGFKTIATDQLFYESTTLNYIFFRFIKSFAHPIDVFNLPLTRGRYKKRCS